MKWKTIEIILLVTRLIGLLFFIYTTICFGVLEKYNLDGIGNYSAYNLYWNCLVICCLLVFIDCIAQIIKVANTNVSVPYIIQAVLYIASVALVRQIGTTIAPAIFVGFITNNSGVVGYQQMLMCIAVFCVLAIIVTLFYSPSKG